MEPFPDVVVASNDMGMLSAVCSGCVNNSEKVVGNLVTEVRNDTVLEYRGYAIALHEYTCPRCDRTHERTG